MLVVAEDREEREREEKEEKTLAGAAQCGLCLISARLSDGFDRAQAPIRLQD